jgi:hypothetical protein
LNITIPVSEDFDETNFRNAKFVAYVLQTGKSPSLLLSWSGNEPQPAHLSLVAKIENESDIQNVLADTSVANEERTIPAAPEFIVEVLGQKIQLGPIEQVLKVIKCLNADDLRQQLAAPDVSGKALDVYWEIDWAESYTGFSNFPKDKSH